jgi:outer membrane protein assembly factor BamB
VRVIWFGLIIAVLAAALGLYGVQHSAPVLSAGGTSKPTADTAHWNYFRGQASGVSPLSNAPVDWDGAAGRGVIWKTPLKMAGVSSPVLWANHVFITEGDEKERAIVAFDTATGKQLWREVVPDGGGKEPLPSVSGSGLAMPTPACDQNGVYALFGTGDLAACSHDGKPLWRVFLQRPVLGYGFASSPCIGGGLLFVQFDTHENGRVLALDPATGKIVWERERMRGAAWSSPIVLPGVDGKPEFVANAPGSLTAFDSTGEVVWDVDGVSGEVTPSTGYWNGNLYAVNVRSFLVCYKVAREPERLWQYSGSLSDTSSPVVVNGLVFMAASNGKLACVDALTGKELWAEKHQGCYASLVASGDRVYALGRNGTTRIVAAERAFRLIATCSLGEPIDATPALGDGRMYIRGRDHLWCLGDK